MRKASYCDKELFFFHSFLVRFDPPTSVNLLQVTQSSVLLQLRFPDELMERRLIKRVKFLVKRHQKVANSDDDKITVKTKIADLKGDITIFRIDGLKYYEKYTIECYTGNHEMVGKVASTPLTVKTLGKKL